MSASRTQPALSVVIPFYNRANTVAFTLESLARARGPFELETILVDDGSTPAAADQLRGMPHQPTRILRQENQGLLFARLAGLAAATGEYVLFLDSDDLVGPEKLHQQLAAMSSTGADISYTDTAVAELHAPYDSIKPEPDNASIESTTDSAVFFIRVQPAPHSPIFRTTWLRRVVSEPLFPPSPLYNPVAEIWFYHIAAIHPASVLKVPGAHTIIGHHRGERLTNLWEKMAVASLGVMETFTQACPANAGTSRARQLVGEKAFNSWRALPHDFFPEFDRRLLQIWRKSPRGPLQQLGGRKFQWLARLVGAVSAGRVLRRLTGRSYASCRALQDPSTFAGWMSQLPPA